MQARPCRRRKNLTYLQSILLFKDFSEAAPQTGEAPGVARRRLRLVLLFKDFDRKSEQFGISKSEAASPRRRCSWSEFRAESPSRRSSEAASLRPSPA
jgi:hypothetical protein